MNKNGKIIAFLGIAGVATGCLIYISKRNQAEGEALLDVINKGYSDVDKNAAGNQAIQNIQNVKFDPNKIRIGNLTGALSNPAIATALAKANVQLATSMKGVGTDIKPFFNALAQIKNKNTLMIVDKSFKAQYGEGLFEMMAGEAALNNVAYQKYSDKTQNALAIPFLNDAHWNPILSTYLEKLPIY